MQIAAFWPAANQSVERWVKLQTKPAFVCVSEYISIADSPVVHEKFALLQLDFPTNSPFTNFGIGVRGENLGVSKLFLTILDQLRNLHFVFWGYKTTEDGCYFGRSTSFISGLKVIKAAGNSAAPNGDVSAFRTYGSSGAQQSGLCASSGQNVLPNENAKNAQSSNNSDDSRPDIDTIEPKLRFSIAALLCIFGGCLLFCAVGDIIGGWRNSSVIRGLCLFFCGGLAIAVSCSMILAWALGGGWFYLTYAQYLNGWRKS